MSERTWKDDIKTAGGLIVLLIVAFAVCRLAGRIFTTIICLILGKSEPFRDRKEGVWIGLFSIATPFVIMAHFDFPGPEVSEYDRNLHRDMLILFWIFYIPIIFRFIVAIVAVYKGCEFEVLGYLRSRWTESTKSEEEKENESRYHRGMFCTTIKEKNGVPRGTEVMISQMVDNMHARVTDYNNNYHVMHVSNLWTEEDEKRIKGQSEKRKQEEEAILRGEGSEYMKDVDIDEMFN